ncbi:MAG: 4-hydroxybenzoyl-CoA reductase subunit alpha [bacterium]
MAKPARGNGDSAQNAAPAAAPPGGAHRTVGRPTPLIEGVAKVTGGGKYTADLAHPDALVVRVLRSPHAHARIDSIDVSAALAMPGVRAVVSGADSDVPFGVLPIAEDEFALARDKVRFKGDEVAAVAAVDGWTAERALERIEVVYQPLPAYDDPREAMAEGAELLHQRRPGNVDREVDHEFGDVARGMAASAVVLEETFFAPEVTHAPLEPHAAMARWNPHDGRLTLWSSTQVPHFVHQTLAAVLKLPMSAVRVIKPMVGGGFGGKAQPLSHEVICALLARKTRATVKLVLSREELAYVNRGRPATWTRLKLGAAADGRLLAVESQVIQRGGAYGSYGVVTILYAGSLLHGLYDIPNVRFNGYRVLTNTPPCGAMRGHGTVDVRFAFESMLDVLAARLGMDPVQLRRVNLLKTPAVTANDLRVNSYGFPECIEQVVRASGFQQKAGRLPFGKGIGFAGSHMVSGAAKHVHRSQKPHAVVTLKLDSDGRITLFTGAPEIGQGSSTILMQIAAEAIGVGPGRIHVIAADSAATPTDDGAFSSRITLFVGNAALQAAQRMRAYLFDAAARGLGAAPDAVELVDDRFRLLREPSRSLSFDEVLELALADQGTLIAKGSYTTPENVRGGSNYRGAGVGATPAFSYSAQAVEVDVDIRTGKVTIERVTVAHDCGFAINPLAVRGQVEGSVWMGMAQAQLEQNSYHKGLPLAPNLLDYRFPTVLDSPQIHTIIVESNEQGGPYGAKEASEGSLAAFPPALANAIADAVGIRLTDMPLSPEKLHAAIQKARRAARIAQKPTPPPPGNRAAKRAATENRG